MFFFEKILAEVNEIVASGAFVRPELQFNDERDVILAEITESRFKAFYTVCGKYEAAAEKAEHAFLRSMIRSYTRNDLDGNFDNLELAVATALADEQNAQEIFDIELVRAYPQLLDKDRLGFRAGWLVVGPKRSGSNQVSQEIDHRFQDARTRGERCNDPECPVHGTKARAASEGNDGVLQKSMRMRHNMRAFKNRNGPL